MSKRYYWLKLKNTFFKDKRMKKLRNIAGGDTYTIIYLKMQLLSLQDEGCLYFENIENTFEEEIALDIDEDVENVKVVINFLKATGLLKEINQNVYELVETKSCIGSETDSARRVRIHRENIKKALQCNTLVTKCNTEKEKEKELEIEKDKKNNILYDENVEKINKLFIENIGSTNLNNMNECLEFLKYMDYEVIEHAFKKTARLGAKWNFTVTVLEEYKDDNVKTIEGAKAHDLNRKKAKAPKEETDEERLARKIKEMEEYRKQNGYE